MREPLIFVGGCVLLVLLLPFVPIAQAWPLRGYQRGW